ncbi:MAG TPA: ATP-binding protein [Methylomirabilota bacterium]|nr:ATP-binding protein [Methylomirabilota bacterium]
MRRAPAGGGLRGGFTVGILLLLFTLPSGTLADETAAPRTVLALFEETRLLPSVAETDDAIRSTLQAGSPTPIRLYTEYLGLSWFPEEGRELALRDLLQKTYASRKPDVVIVWGTGALRFVLRHRAALFDGVPVVFCAVDPALLPRLDAGSAVTGVSRRIDWTDALDLIMRLHPGTREVAIVTGSGAVDLRWEAEARRAFHGYRGEARLTYLARRPMPQLLQAVGSLSPGTIVLYGAVLQDGAGRPYLPREALALVVEASRVPVYAVTANMLGHGVVGGRLLDFPSQGVTAAKLALRVLGGERLGPGDIVEADNPYLFDWRQLRRWQIDEGRLPPASVVRFRQASVWDLYKDYIIAAVILIAAQSLLIAALLVQRARRQRAEDEARARREELAHAQRVATIGELSASLAHELNQPLTAIATNAQAARRSMATSRAEGGELSEVLVDIADDARRAGAIVRRMRALVRKQPGERQPVDVNLAVTEVTRILRRDIARAEGGELSETLVDIADDARRAGAIVRRMRALIRKQPGERQPVDINLAVTEVTRILRRDIAQAEVSLHLRLGEDLPPVIGDVVQLQQVVLNLLINACQAMAGVENRPRVLRIETSEPKPGSIEIAVADAGAGVPESELERMFEPFVSSKAGGLGMGLSISRSIIEAHDGHIWATRNPDRGLTLHVTLPSASTGHANPRYPVGPPGPDEVPPVAAGR